MPGKKYTDFAESEPKQLQSKHVTGEMRLYVTITCPHCTTDFVDIPAERLEISKASKCLQHLRVCEVFKNKGGEVASAPEKKHKDPAFTDLMERMQDLESTVASQGTTIASQGATIASHDAMVDVLVDEYGMFRPITDQNVRPQIKMLLDHSSATSTTLVSTSDAERMRQQQETIIMQKDGVITEQKQLLAQKDTELDRTKSALDASQVETARLEAMVKRIQGEREAIENKLRSQLKRERCGTSKSLLAQAEQGQKAYVLNKNLLPKSG